MIFRGLHDQTVEFKVTNYQYPEIKTGDWDGNWLLIYLKVKSEVGNWQTVDPSLTTWDIKRLAKWFKDLSHNQKVEKNPIEFTEPNLCFEKINDDLNTKTIRIRFELESRPQSAEENKEYFVDFKYTCNELNEVAIELEKELDKFPER
ncbi:MAG: hypothetical protein M0P47_12020 [Bacteroidales bacterium]|nr:hypothetical protein [Bacteroidales bacterium]